MNEQEYRQAVIKMRTHQDAWFRLHQRSDLIEAKRLEKLIDAENKLWLDALKEQRPTSNPTPALPILEEHQNGEGAEEQANLFTGDDNGKTS